MNIERLQDMVQRMNRIIPGPDASVVIAGGAPRDAILGGKARDVDVYVRNSNYLRLFEHLWPDNPPNAHEFQQGDVEYQHQAIERCYEELVSSMYWKQQFPELEEMPINLVVLKDNASPEEVIHSFNLSTSQVMVHPLWTDTVRHPAFIQDVAKRQVTVLRTDWGATFTQNTIRKFITKYPDFKVVLEDGNEFDWELWDQEHIDRVTPEF